MNNPVISARTSNPLSAASAPALATAVLAFAALTAFSGAAQAGIVSYTDRASWQAASGGGSGDIFDNLDSHGTARAGFTVSGNAALTGNLNPTTSVDGSGYLRVLLEGGENVMTLTFKAPVRSLGFDLNPWCSIDHVGDDLTNCDTGAMVIANFDGVLTSYQLPTADVNGFLGFVSDTAFTTFTVITSEKYAWHGMDNLEAFSGSVPEPMSALLVAVALLAAGTATRRRAGMAAEHR